MTVTTTMSFISHLQPATVQ